MEALLANDKLLLFAVFVFPGLVSMHVYRLRIAARDIEWKTAILEGLFYSIVNFALCFPLLVTITYYDFPHHHPIWFALGILVILLVGPMLWPLLLVKGIRSEKLMKHLQLPYPTAWDAFLTDAYPVSCSSI